MKPISRPTLLITAAALLSAGCSTLEEDKVNYKSARTTSTLDVPPDLTQLRRDSRYNLESTSATASGFDAAAGRVSDAGTATNTLGDVRMERSGAQRWLVVNRPADRLWEPLKEFWTSNGFVLTTDAPELGILETDWAENRAKLPQDVIRRTLGKLFDSLYSTGERDRFRTRVERNTQGGVEIYITHRGMQEVFASNERDRTIWQPRPADAELEIELLRRLMVKLGSSPDQARAAVGGPAPTSAPVPSQPVAISRVNDLPAIVLTEDSDRTWRRLGVALDRTGFTVEDRNRQQGVYFVRYVAVANTTAQPGLLSRLFGNESAKAPALARYRVMVSPRGTGSMVQVLDTQGQPETSANAEKILTLIAPEMR